MAQLSNTVLDELTKMDEYDRLLSLDRIARENNVTVDQVKEQLRVYQQGGTSTISNPSHDEMIAPQSQTEDTTVTGQQPNYLQDAHRYRVRYDPSHDGQSRQANVEQAILCPHCGAPLGIPAIRPIKVTCPNCMNEAMFET
ncbi:MAG TPA: hypothetical protein QF621_01950 [Candidatus Thalassarchaeaceae archaeon]|nr:hypothetical protein [Candidatus Thalassarchaeaceae archaeon]